MDELLAVDSLHLFPKSETQKGGLDLQLSLISNNYLVMGQVARPPSRTASNSERIQALVARHSQSWSSPASGSRLRVRVTQPPRSKSSVQEGSAHRSAIRVGSEASSGATNSGDRFSLPHREETASVRPSQEGRSQHSSSSQRGKQDAPKGPEKVP